MIRPNPSAIVRKSCKQSIDHEIVLPTDHKGSRSRSVDSGTSKSYQKDLINEKKKSIFLNQQQKTKEEEETNEDKVSNGEKSSPDSKGEEVEEISSGDSSEKQELPAKIIENPPFNKKMMIQIEDEKEEVKNEEMFQQDIKDLGTQ